MSSTFCVFVQGSRQRPIYANCVILLLYIKDTYVKVFDGKFNTVVVPEFEE